MSVIYGTFTEVVGKKIKCLFLTQGVDETTILFSCWRQFKLEKNVSFSKKSAVTHFDMHNLIFGINFLSHFVSFVLITLPMMSHLIVIHLPLSHHFQHPSHIQYFIASSELTFSTDPFHRSLPAHTGLPRRTLFTGTDLSC